MAGDRRRISPPRSQLVKGMLKCIFETFNVLQKLTIVNDFL